MRTSRVATRYAEALFELTQEREAVEDIRSQLLRLVKLLDGSEALRQLLARADIPAEAKHAAVEEALGEAFSQEIIALLGTLVDHDRGALVGEVAAAYEHFADEAAGIVAAEACTAVSLTEQQRARMISALERMIGKQIRLQVRVDPSVLAGVRLQVGDRLIDGSAAGRLARLREELLDVTRMMGRED